MNKTAELLDELGFSRGCIVETIVTTRNPDGSPRAAPMGVTRKETDLLEIKPFKTSVTYRNLLKNTYACVNLTEDPALFLVTAFKHEDLQGFEQPHIEEDLSLSQADASIFVEVLSGGDLSENRGCFVCRARSVEVRRPFPRVFSRGRAEAIEAVIHATRVEAHLHMGRREEAEKLIKRLDECKGVVERVSPPDSAEVRVIRTLETLIRGWEEAWR